MSAPKREVMVEPSSHTVAIAQARAFAAQVHTLGKTIQPSGHPAVIGNQIAFLVLVGLTLELYCKAFMIRARAGRVTVGHDLSKLIEEFPPFLREAFAAEYKQLLREIPDTYTTTAIILSKERPTTPHGNGPGVGFNGFEECMGSLADAFVRFRYLFENVKYASWTRIPFPNDYALAAIQTMEIVYVRFERREFKGQLNPASA